MPPTPLGIALGHWASRNRALVLSHPPATPHHRWPLGARSRRPPCLRSSRIADRAVAHVRRGNCDRVPYACGRLFSATCAMPGPIGIPSGSHPRPRGAVREPRRRQARSRRGGTLSPAFPTAGDPREAARDVACPLRDVKGRSAWCQRSDGGVRRFSRSGADPMLAARSRLHRLPARGLERSSCS